MLGRKDNELERLLKIVNISDNELERLDYKGKQEYFKAKNKLCRVVHKSRDEKGNGITYRKRRVNNER